MRFENYESDVDIASDRVETGTAITDLSQLQKSQIEKQKREISEQFDILSQREDNWDGRGSQKPTELTLVHAKVVMNALLDSVTSVGYRCDTPSISSDGDGYVTAVWYKNERQLHLQIGEHEAEYFKVWGTNIDTEMDVDFLKPENYVPLWKWLIAVARAEDARDLAQLQLTADAPTESPTCRSGTRQRTKSH